MPYRLAIPHQHETGKKKNGEPTGIRTPDTRLRRPLLYPTELWTHNAQLVFKKMERMMRIELTLSAWKAEVLPLNYIRKLERKTRFELATLALARRCSTPEPLPHILVEGDGFEPSKAVLTDLQSAPFGRSGTPRKVLELMEGIEPPTC